MHHPPHPASRPFAWPAPGPDRSIWRFRAQFPVPAGAEPVTLGEGGTPLLPSRLFPDLALWWKDETRNPTGSHKDRALSLAATHARAIGATTMAVVSAGSTGIANAAYAARAGLRSVVIMGQPAPPQRLYPVFALGSAMIEFDCGIDALIGALDGLNGQSGLYVCSTVRASNPVQAEAARTIAYEIVEALGAAPDWIIVPTGGGGTLSAIGQGLFDLQAAGLIDTLPRLAAIVPAHFDALRAALAGGIDSAAAFAALAYDDLRETVLTKLAHAHPPDGLEALEVLRRTRGVVIPVSDEAAMDAVARIGRTDGLYLEPSSAVVLPALEALRAQGQIRPGHVVAALACGAGFRETFLLNERRPASLRKGTLADLAALLGA